MPANVGNQRVTVKFFDPVDSEVANRIGLGTRPVGIYTGGYLTKVSDVSVSVSALTCEIGDGTYQLRVEMRSAYSVTVGVATPYVILRWTYTGVAAADYMEVLGVGSGAIVATDIIIGEAVFVGATLTGFLYTERGTPLTLATFLKAEPTVAASMYLRVRGGWCNFGSANYDINDQLSPLFTAPVANSRIDLLYVNTSGVLAIAQGTAAASPVAPDYNFRLVIAEVTLAAATVSLTTAEIKDVRNLLPTYSKLANNIYLKAWNAAGTGNVNLIKANASNVPVVPDGAQNATSAAPAAAAALANKKYVDDTIAAAIAAAEKSFGPRVTQLSPAGGGPVAIIAKATPYLAATDGFVMGYQDGGAYATVMSDAANPPTTKVWDNGATSVTSPGSQWGIFAPIIAGQFWQVDCTNTVHLFWLPLA